MQEDFARPSPADLDAERWCLSALMSGKRALAEVCELLEPGDFYRPAHQMIYRACVSLFAQGIEADAVTVRAYLEESGEISRCGGPVYVAELYGLPSVSAAAGRYAAIIRDRAARRKVIEIGTRLLHRGYELDHDLAELVSWAQGEVGRAVMTAGDARRLGTDLQSLDGFAANEAVRQAAVIPGLLDHMDRVVLVGLEGDGKALAADTPIPTPKGWTTMGDLAPGDEVFTPGGSPTQVVAATPVMHGRPCYRVRFSDGPVIVADANHQWLTETERERQFRHPGAVRTTGMIAATLMSRPYGHGLNHSVACSEPLAYPAQELPVDPWLLGAWLGDGTTRNGNLSVGGEDLAYVTGRLDQLGERHAERDYAGTGNWAVQVYGLMVRLRSLGTLGAKHIPDRYQRASVAQRMELLRGLMDTDGSVTSRGSRTGRGYGRAQCELSLMCEPLAMGALELLTGLGVKVTMRPAPAKLAGRIVGTRYRLLFQTSLPVFGLPRKAARLTPQRTRRSALRYVAAVEPVESVPVRCIQVADPSGMFVAGRECIPTHNSMIATQVAMCAAAGVHPFTYAPVPPVRVLVCDFENPPHLLQTRMRRLRDIAERQPGWSSARMSLFVHPDYMDLTQPSNQFRLTEVIRSAKPDFIAAGPIYKMMIDRGQGAEQLHSQVTAYWDRVRAETGAAVWLETHPPKAPGGQARRLEPYGWGGYMRWPEFGLTLERCKGEWRLGRFKGDREEGRTWPEKLSRSTAPLPCWPWEATYPAGTFTDPR